MVPENVWNGLFSPKSVAVIGASNSVGSWGERITKQLLSSKNRLVYAINPGYPEILGLPSYKSILDIPDPVDLGIIVVRAELVPGALRELAEKKVPTALIISGGFSETDEAGARLQDEIVEIANRGGIRFIGPNTMGHLDTFAGMNSLSFMENIPKGPVSLIAQSGNMGSRIMQNVIRHGIGLNKFVCCGNEADITLEDYLEYFAGDPETKIIMLYVEGLRDARRFLEVAGKITKTKPVVVMKAGGTKNSARASRSHTGALAGSDAAYTAAFRQAGVIRVEDDDELCDVSIALLNQPLPRSNRVGILTMGGGLGVVTAEACEKEGLEIAELGSSTVEKLDEMLPSRWSHSNPVDLVGSNIGNGPDIMSVLWILMQDVNLDIIISNAWLGRMNRIPQNTPTAEHNENPDSEKKKVKEFSRQVKKYNKPLLMIGSPPQRPSDLEAFTLFHKEGFLVYPQPNRAAKTLRHMIWYKQYLESSNA
ncbi:acetate--CoA ligase family protein [Chloroflexota bacterium]